MEEVPVVALPQAGVELVLGQVRDHGGHPVQPGLDLLVQRCPSGRVPDRPQRPAVQPETGHVPVRPGHLGQPGGDEGRVRGPLLGRQEPELPVHPGRPHVLGPGSAGGLQRPVPRSPPAGRARAQGPKGGAQQQHDDQQAGEDQRGDGNDPQVGQDGRHDGHDGGPGDQQCDAGAVAVPGAVHGGSSRIPHPATA
ncbi:hypothetical protein [Kocuria sp. CNJ-770]|uniref:hypothetical protein n=1 Tax=Kocuria sp. CNJ-770 TaxID=1904964 RepID=UPI00111518E8|nr:hypothetical protein [Kocuria sp. CNJ-770]